MAIRRTFRGSVRLYGGEDGQKGSLWSRSSASSARVRAGPSLVGDRDLGGVANRLLLCRKISLRSVLAYTGGTKKGAFRTVYTILDFGHFSWRVMIAHKRHLIQVNELAMSLLQG